MKFGLLCLRLWTLTSYNLALSLSNVVPSAYVFRVFLLRILSASSRDTGFACTAGLYWKSEALTTSSSDNLRFLPPSARL